MLKQTVRYTDFDGNPVEETLWFHISRSDFIDHLPMKAQLEDLQARLGGQKRELTDVEKVEVLGVLKLLVELAYGVRRGKAHIKTKEAWEEFRYSPAYDEFLFGLMAEEEGLSKFLAGVMPNDLREQLFTATTEDGQPIIPASVQQKLEEVNASIAVEAANENPEGMTREELLEKFNELRAQQAVMPK